MSSIVLSLAVPNNTPIRTPVAVEDNAPLPVITGGEIVIPGGCVGLVGVRLSHRGQPLYPDNGGWLTGNSRTISWGGLYLMAGPPFTLRLEAYNLDDTWAHRLEATINLADVRSLGR